MNQAQIPMPVSIGIGRLFVVYELDGDGNLLGALASKKGPLYLPANAMGITLDNAVTDFEGWQDRIKYHSVPTEIHPASTFEQHLRRTISSVPEGVYSICVRRGVLASEILNRYRPHHNLWEIPDDDPVWPIVDDLLAGPQGNGAVRDTFRRHAEDIPEDEAWHLSNLATPLDVPTASHANYMREHYWGVLKK